MPYKKRKIILAFLAGQKGIASSVLKEINQSQNNGWNVHYTFVPIVLDTSPSEKQGQDPDSSLLFGKTIVASGVETSSVNMQFTQPISVDPSDEHVEHIIFFGYKITQNDYRFLRLYTSSEDFVRKLRLERKFPPPVMHKLKKKKDSWKVSMIFVGIHYALLDVTYVVKYWKTV